MLSPPPTISQFGKHATSSNINNQVLARQQYVINTQDTNVSHINTSTILQDTNVSHINTSTICHKHTRI